MKKKIKSETRNSAVNDVDPSHLTSHRSHSLVTFFNHLSHSLITFHILCIVFLILIIYSNTLNAPFQWDEGTFIVDNPILKNLHYFTNPSDAAKFPLYTALINRYIGYLTFALNYRIHGLSVTGYHIVNIAIHIANSVLVYLLVLLTFRTPLFKTVNGEEVNGEWIKTEKAKLKDVPFSPFTIHHSRSLTDSRSSIAFFSAAIFAVHPLQTEAVTYVFQRFASLVTFFYLLSLAFYIKARLALTTECTEESLVLKKPKKFFWSAQRSSRLEAPTFWLWLILSFISAVLAMKTKENAFTLPLIITLYEFCFFSRFASHGSRSLSISDSPKVGALEARFTIHGLYRFTFLVPILLTLLIIPLTLMSLAGSHQLDPGAYGFKVKEFSRWDYFFTQFRALVTYLRLLFFPLNQNISYDYPVFNSFFDLPVVLSFVFLAVLFGLGVYFIRSSRFTFHVSRPLRLMGFGILWFFITLSVESSIIPLPMLIDEYRMYLPSIGMIICVVTGVFLLFSRFTFHDSRFTAFKTVVFFVLIIGVLSVATYLRNDLWGDSIKLWEDTIDKAPRNAKAHYNLGLFYQGRNMPDKAMEQYLITVNLSPGFAEAYNNIGHIYEGRNMHDKAMVYYQIATELSPNLAEAHYNLGLFYQARNMPDSAEEQFLKAVKLKPDYVKAHYNLGLFYQARNMFDKAMEQYLTVIKLKPDHADARFNLGYIYLALNMPDKALDQLQIAANLKPADAEAHFNLGAIYYRMGQKENARRELITGLKIKPDDQQAQQLLQNVN